MRVIITRPEPAAERTAAALRARGHEVLKAPLLRIETVSADIPGDYSAIVISSANAPAAISRHPKRNSLLNLPLFAVGARSAESAREAGFANVTFADGDGRDLSRLIAGNGPGKTKPLLYLAGEDRTYDLAGDLAAHGFTVETRIVYRAVTSLFPQDLIAAIRADEADAVLHFSARSAANYVAGAKAADLPQALALRHYCLSAQVAAPLREAGTARVAIATRPDEAAVLDLIA